MLLTVLKAKIHLATVTDVKLHYNGSCAIDSDWLDEVGIIEGEQLHIFNQMNGERLITYAIPAPAGSKRISLNGAAARKAMTGDRVIIVAYAHMTNLEAADFKPKIKTFPTHKNGPWGSTRK